MTHATRRLSTALAGLAILSVVIAACGGNTVSPSPSSGPSAAPTASPTATPSATPAATVVPTPSPSIAAVCNGFPQSVVPPSDRLTSVAIDYFVDREVVHFSFGNPSLEPSGPASAALDTATPPFTEAGSGKPIKVDGSHTAQVVFKGMSLQNDAAESTFVGVRQIRSDDASATFKQVTLFDELEGQLGFYVGYDDARCVSLGLEGNDVLVTIALELPS